MPDGQDEVGFRFQNVLCYADPFEPQAFYYRPASPMPERDPTGRPSLILWLGEAGSRLQFAAQWTAEEPAIAALRTEIMRRYPERRLSPSAIRLLPELADIDRVSLEIGAGTGTGVFTEVQCSPSSGYPPYNALFNAALTPEHARQAARALNGAPDCVRVIYRGSIRRSGKGHIPFEASADVSAWFPDGSGTGHIRIIPT
ncbi:hypothetical protein [Paenibacillus oceani]|uniref:Uncharacterized protein n=1 Tax=Paenibacillus oceani TaxID=2772510 RepID=A0A927H263_9BACL|nr:hypothetical protein [Paenibacillus oceani]MBD2864932.1 hypothetical protein [Paenibacillus oceani]